MYGQFNGMIAVDLEWAEGHFRCFKSL